MRIKMHPSLFKLNVALVKCKICNLITTTATRYKENFNLIKYGN